MIEVAALAKESSSSTDKEREKRALINADAATNGLSRCCVRTRAGHRLPVGQEFGAAPEVEAAAVNDREGRSSPAQMNIFLYGSGTCMP